MLQKLNTGKPDNQVLLIGIIFLMAGLGALVVIREPTPLLMLGILFVLTPMIPG